MAETGSGGLQTRIRQWFKLTQAEFGRCLGLSKAMIWQIERGLRGVPLPATLPQMALSLAFTRTAAQPETAEAPDAAALRKQLRTCQHRARQLAYALSLLPEQATWARRRLAALPTLHEVLTADGAPLPAWVSRFEADAHTELARSGSTAQVLLQARIAGLQAEATELERQLALL